MGVILSEILKFTPPLEKMLATPLPRNELLWTVEVFWLVETTDDWTHSFSQ